MKLRILNLSNNPIPEYQSIFAAGMDLRAFITDPDGVKIKPMERKLISTGIHVAIPKGYEGQIRSRSGLAYRQGLVVVNAPGTIDSDYRGKILIAMINLSTETHTIKNGDRLAQIIFSPCEHAEVEEVFSLEELGDTERGSGGFGHTGVK